MNWIKGNYQIVTDEKTGGRFFALKRGDVNRLIKKHGGDKLISEIPLKNKEKILLAGYQIYNLDNHDNKALVLGLLNINAEADSINFLNKFGPLGIYWHVYNPDDGLSLKLKYVKYLTTEAAFNKDKVEPVEIMILNEINETSLSWYREHVDSFDYYVSYFKHFSQSCLNGNSLDKFIFSTTVNLVYVNGKPTWLPKAKTLLERAFIVLPLLLMEGIQFKKCSRCGLYFTEGVNLCKTCGILSNATRQKRCRQREKVYRHIILKGESLSDTCSGLDQKETELIKNNLEKMALMSPVDVKEKIKSGDQSEEKIRRWQEISTRKW